jgi:hypothetical protein
MRPRSDYSSDVVDAAMDQARMFARTVGQEDQFDRIVSAAKAHDFARLDKLIDELIPGTGGFHQTFLPSFAMSSLESFMRNRSSWRRLRDRIFDNMDEVEKLAGSDGCEAINVWRELNKPYAREAD